MRNVEETKSDALVGLVAKILTFRQIISSSVPGVLKLLLFSALLEKALSVLQNNPEHEKCFKIFLLLDVTRGELAKALKAEGIELGLPSLKEYLVKKSATSAQVN